MSHAVFGDLTAPWSVRRSTSRMTAVDHPISMMPFSAERPEHLPALHGKHVAIAERPVTAEGEIDKIGARRRGVRQAVGEGPQHHLDIMPGDEKGPGRDDDDGALHEIVEERAVP